MCTASYHNLDSLAVCEKERIFKHLESADLREDVAALQQQESDYEKQRKKIGCFVVCI